MNIAAEQRAGLSREDNERSTRELRLVTMAAAREWVERCFGERCPEPSDNCECCRRWNLFDELFAEVES